MWVQAAAIVLVIIAGSYGGFAAGRCSSALGTAMVYPTLLAAVGDVAHPSWRASAVGVYRFWRDLGYAVGALVAGAAADALGLAGAMWLVAGLTLVVGHRRRRGDADHKRSLWAAPRPLISGTRSVSLNPR